MNNKGASFMAYLLLVCVLTAGLFILFPDKAPLAIPTDLGKGGLPLTKGMLPPEAQNAMVSKFQQEMLGADMADSALFREVQVKEIPQSVYDSMALNSDYSKYLRGSQKRVFAVLPSGCPYARAFIKALNSAFSDPEIASVYHKDIIRVGHSEMIWCKGGAECPKSYLLETCGEGICIINPAQRQIVVDNSQRSSGIIPLLKHYKNW